MSNGKPIVGVVGDYADLKKVGALPQPHYFFDDVVYRTLVELGATPIGILTPCNLADSVVERAGGETYELARRQLYVCDGVFFQDLLGGTSFFNAMARLAYQLGLPTLGVGNSLAALASVFDSAVLEMGKHAMHEYLVRLDTGSIIQKAVLGATGGTTMTVRSNSALRLAEPMKVQEVAVTVRNCSHTIEAIEARGERFYVGTRFRPELTYQTNPSMRAILEAFIKAL